MRIIILITCLATGICCNNNKTGPDPAVINDLKRGEIISCGPQEGQVYGRVLFNASIPTSLQEDFNTAIALLHSFEYDEAEKMFVKVLDADPGCAMAWWGVAMSNFHPLWAPPSAAELKKGIQAIGIARSIKSKTSRESDYIEALAGFFEKADVFSHRERVLKFEKGMERIYKLYPEDVEADIFYALALNTAADPVDKTYSRQRKAFDLLQPIYEQQPLHPGVAHYIIHNMDYPGIAELALPAARKYASIAPASAHAQHMPSHIFIRMGLWDESIKSDLNSVSSAKCYAEQAKLKGHWDEELHGMDYLVYAYLQKNDEKSARQQLDYLATILEVYPVNFKVAYAFAAMPARYALERKDWKMAAALQLHPSDFPWNEFPWQEAIIHFARVLGQVHLNNLPEAERELAVLKTLYHKLENMKNMTSEAAQVDIQVASAEAWVAWKKGDTKKAREKMILAADKEDAMEKHPVTPCAVLPARELLGELLLQLGEPGLAVSAFEQNLRTNPNRLNGVKGLQLAKQKVGKD